MPAQRKMLYGIQTMKVFAQNYAVCFKSLFYVFNQLFEESKLVSSNFGKLYQAYQFNQPFAKSKLFYLYTLKMVSSVTYNQSTVLLSAILVFCHSLMKYH